MSVYDSVDGTLEGFPTNGNRVCLPRYLRQWRTDLKVLLGNSFKDVRRKFANCGRVPSGYGFLGYFDEGEEQNSSRRQLVTLEKGAVFVREYLCAENFTDECHAKLVSHTNFVFIVYPVHHDGGFSHLTCAFDGVPSQPDYDWAGKQLF
jgi:hypothetical protein